MTASSEKTTALLTGREWASDPDHPAHEFERAWEARCGREVYVFEGGRRVELDPALTGKLLTPVIADLARRGAGVALVLVRDLPEWTGGGMAARIDGVDLVTLDVAACGDDLADAFAHEVGHLIHPRGHGAHVPVAEKERIAEAYAEQWRNRAPRKEHTDG